MAELAASKRASRRVASGLIATEELADVLVFEQQRILDAQSVAIERLKPISDETLAELLCGVRGSVRWTTHAYALSDAPAERIRGIEKTVLRLAFRAAGDLARSYRPPHRAEKMDDVAVLQLCLAADALWHGTSPLARLSSRQPGGMVRMKDDPRAPSRSYLKIEEAFTVMNEWPQAGQSVIDLGAAPGGWTWAFLKRGAHVVAVDNGPLKLPTIDDSPSSIHGSVSHLRADGIAFTPDRPVDWLVGDMLIPPGVALGLLKRWIEHRWMRRFVVNIKLPQEQPYPALVPIASYLRSQVSRLRFQIRHLYHDRREVTVMGFASHRS